jgi:CheY-like chemotaxis protein
MVQVLIFDDNPDQLHLLRRHIEGEGRELLAAGSVPEAVELLKRHSPGLVVADIRFGRGGQLDKEAGLELLELAKAKDNTIQVILVTNYASPEISRKAMEQGAFDILDRTPTGLDFWAMLRAKVKLALHYRELLLRDRDREAK